MGLLIDSLLRIIAKFSNPQEVADAECFGWIRYMEQIKIDNEYPQFIDEPCPECKKNSTETGYNVQSDCKQCLGTGRIRK